MKTIDLSWLAAACGVLALTASPAMAHEFTKSPAESGYGGKGATQTFKIKGVTITCGATTIDGAFNATKSEELPLDMTFSSCTSALKTATVSESMFTFHANNTVAIAEKSQITITTKPSAEGVCEFKLPESSAVNTAGYKNNGTSGIIINSELKGLPYELKETGTFACGTNGEKGTTGEYTGEVKTETYEGLVCRYIGWLRGRYKDAACTELSVFLNFYEDYAVFSSLGWA
jgi:hypothetical protein